MKKIFLAFALSAFFALGSTAQTAWGFGFKGGLNYSSNGDLIDAVTDNVEHPDRNIGYHLGIFGKVGTRIYFRPELVYTQTKSDYNDNSFSVQKLDTPLLLGIKVIGPVSVFGGPSFQYILDTEYDSFKLGQVENEFTVGLNFGVSVSYKKLGLDLRYERGFSENEATLFNNAGIPTGRLDTRPDQLILSFSFIL